MYKNYSSNYSFIDSLVFFWLIDWSIDLQESISINLDYNSNDNFPCRYLILTNCTK